VEQQSRDWTKEALAHGYVVFVLDSLNQRGAKDFCGERGRGSGGVAVKDVFQALEHLKHFDFVDPDRVGLMGFSWGAIIALYASSPAVAKAFSVAKRFPAVVALYPACYIPASSTDILRADTDLPLLVLMGARDTPPFSTDCVSRLETLKARGAPVAWELYPEATHCWDCTGAQNVQGVDFAGNRRISQYSSTVTQDSRRRAFEFLNNHLKRRPGS
jgi:dienelactone hydrolase